MAAHGIRGEVKVQTFTETPDQLDAYGPLSDEQGRRSFKLTVTGSWKEGAIAQVDGIADRTSAEALKRQRLYISRDRLEREGLQQDEFYQADLIGLEAFDLQGAKLGRIVDLANFGAGDLLELQLEGEGRGQAGQTVYVPFTLSIVPKVDLVLGRILVDAPEGLLETQPRADEALDE